MKKIKVTRHEVLRFQSIRDRYEDKDCCWEWDGCISSKGYGVYSRNKLEFYAHRISYAVFVSDPGDLLVCHHCDNPVCVNPGHLFLGTHQDNMLDMSQKGRGRCHRGEENNNCRFTDSQVVEMRILYRNGLGSDSIGLKFGTSGEYVRQVVSGQIRVSAGGPIASSLRNYKSGSKNHMSKLSELQRVEIRRIYSFGGVTVRQLAKQYGVAHSTVVSIIGNRKKKKR